MGWETTKGAKIAKEDTGWHRYAANTLFEEF
jgi:hypothetical protein